jgi:hypothetical protein
LVDDGTLVKFGGDEVRRSAGEFHSAPVRVAVGARTRESRQKRVVDVGRPFARVRVIARHRDDVEGQVTRVSAIRQFSEAMIVLRDHHQGAPVGVFEADGEVGHEGGEGHEQNGDVTGSVTDRSPRCCPRL